MTSATRSKFLYKIFAIALPLIFIISALVFVTFLKKGFEDVRRQLILKDSSYASFEASENLRSAITEKVNILVSIANPHHHIFGREPDHFHSLTKSVRNSIDGFFSISWVDPNMTVRWVESDEKVPAAKGRKATKNVYPYLEESRKTRKPQVSHVGTLFEGSRGFGIFVPIYSPNNVFKGWLTGTVVIEDFLADFFKKRASEDLNVLMKWKSQDSYIFRLGREQPLEEYGLQFETQIYNQVLDVAVDTNQQLLYSEQRLRWNIIFISFYIAIAVISMFLFYIIRSQFKFIKLNSDLRRDKTIISVLSHDIATPLTILIESAKRLKEKLGNQFEEETNRILKSAEKQKELLIKARSFHATNLGKIKINLEPIHVSEIITETLSLYKHHLTEKNISFHVEMRDGILRVLADPMSAVHNVLGNVISNSIKFSKPGTKINIASYKYKKKYVVIEVTDQGAGIPPEIINALFEYNRHSTRKGTDGETGTGLGMLQIKAFMDYYNGAVEIISNEAGTSIKLLFLNADQI